ncbi:MAG: hypothetical protein IPL65_16790 [Lewinellaceae bacterium]|nr:hypothetical protein [Lewinellaceae bacterium]
MRLFIFSFISTILICSSLMSCGKETQPDPVTPELVDTITTPIDTVQHIIEFGKAVMWKNGSSYYWPGTIAANYQGDSISSRFRLRGTSIVGNGYIENISINDIPCQKGKLPIELFNSDNFKNFIPEALYSIVYDGDQILSYYQVDTTRTDHYIEILRYDSVEHIVEGRFQLFMGKTQDSNWLSTPDSILLTGGKFHLKIKEP